MTAFQWPYRAARDGFWGSQTSTLNWCEEDYDITPYCAEFFNSVTNLAFMYLGFSGIANCLRYGHNKIYILVFSGYLSVGLGSIAFHSSLKYSMQLADELPMIYTTCIMAYAVFSHGKSKTTQIFVGLGLGALALWITVIYCVTKNPVFHQVAYAVLVLGLVFRTMFIMEKQLRPALRKRCETPEAADAIVSGIWTLALAGVFQNLFGFFVWNLDNIFCDLLRTARHTILLPWSGLLELHAWWHIFTGIGTYSLIVWRIWLDRCLNGEEQEFMLVWPSVWTSVPKVLPRPGHGAKANGSAKTNGYSNGYSNGHTNGHSKGNGVNGNGVNGSSKKDQ